MARIRESLTPQEIASAAAMGINPEHALKIINSNLAREDAQSARAGQQRSGRSTDARADLEQRRQQQREQARIRRSGVNEDELMQALYQRAAQQGLVDESGQLSAEGLAQVKRERAQLLREAGAVGPANDARYEERGLKVVQNNQIARGFDADVIGEDQADLQNMGGFDADRVKGGIADPAKAAEERDKAALRRNEQIESPFVQFGQKGRPDLASIEGQNEYMQMLMYPQDGKSRPLTQYEANDRIARLTKQGIFDPVGDQLKDGDFRIFEQNVDKPARDKQGRLGRRISEDGDGPGFVKGKAWNFKWEGEGPDPDRPRDLAGNVVGAKGRFKAVKKAEGNQRRDMGARQKVKLEAGGDGARINPIDAIRSALQDGSLQLDQPITPEMLGGGVVGGGRNRAVQPGDGNKVFGQSFDPNNPFTVGDLLSQLEADQPVQFDAQGRPGILNAEGNRIAAAPAQVERNRMQQIAAAMVEQDELAAAGIVPQADVDRRLRQLQGLIDFPEYPDQDPVRSPGVPKGGVQYANSSDDPLQSLRQRRENLVLANAAADSSTAGLDAGLADLAQRRQGVFGDAMFDAEIQRRRVGVDDVDYGYIPAAGRQASVDLSRVPIAEPVFDGDGFVVDFANARSGEALSTPRPEMPEGIPDLRQDTASWIGNHLENEYDAQRRQQQGLPPNPNLRETPVVQTLRDVSNKFREAGIDLPNDIRSVDDFEAASMQFAEMKGVQPRVKKDRVSGAVIEQRPFVGVEDVVFNLKMDYEQEHALARSLYLAELGNAQQGDPAVIGTNPQMQAAEQWRQGGGFLKPEADVYEKGLGEAGIARVGRQNVPRRFSKKDRKIAQERAGRDGEARALARGIAPAEAKRIGQLAAKQINNVEEFGGPVRELGPRLRQLDPQGRILQARDELLEAIGDPKVGINPNNELLPFLVDRGGNENIDLTSTAGRDRLRDEVKGLASMRLEMVMGDDKEWLDQARGRLVGAAEGDVQQGGRRAADGLLVANGPRFSNEQRANFAENFQRAAGGLPVDSGAADVPYGNQPVLGNREFVAQMNQGLTPQQLAESEQRLAQWGRSLQQQPVRDPRMVQRNLGVAMDRPFVSPLMGGQAPMVRADGAGIQGSLGQPFVNQAEMPAVAAMDAYERDLNLIGGKQREAFAQNAARQMFVQGPQPQFEDVAFGLLPNGEPQLQRAGRDFVRVFDQPNSPDRALIRVPQNVNPGPARKPLMTPNEAIANAAGNRRGAVQGAMASSPDTLMKGLKRKDYAGYGPRKAPVETAQAVSRKPAPDYRDMPFADLQRPERGRPQQGPMVAPQVRAVDRTPNQPIEWEEQVRMGQPPQIISGDPVTARSAAPSVAAMQTAATQTANASARVDAPTPRSRAEQAVLQDAKRNSQGPATAPEGRAQQEAKSMGGRLQDMIGRARNSKRGRMYGGAAAAAGGAALIGGAINEERKRREEEEQMMYR